VERNAQVNLLLNAINKCKMDLVPMYRPEFEMLKRLAPVLPEKVVRDGEGNVRVFYVNKKKTIQILKDLYSFKTKEEAAIVTTDAANNK